MREFVSQGILTEKQLTKPESPIYNDDGHLMNQSNRERSFYCTDCMTINDGYEYETRQSSAYGIIATHRFWLTTCQHTSQPSTTNAQLFRCGRLTFGNMNRLKTSMEQDQTVPLEWKITSLDISVSGLLK